MGLLQVSHDLESTLTRRRLPGVPTAQEVRIIHDLETEGVHVTTIDQLLPGNEGDLSDSRMAVVVPRERWKRCIGAAGTVVLCDTGKVFHHESLQRERDRVVVMLGYSSRRPKNIRNAMAHFPVERVRSALMQIVPPENHGHVFGWRR